MVLTDGTTQMKDLREKSENKCGIVMPRSDCAIWDLQVFNNGGATQVIIAEDSGKVKLGDIRN